MKLKVIDLIEVVNENNDIVIIANCKRAFSPIYTEDDILKQAVDIFHPLKSTQLIKVRDCKSFSYISIYKVSIYKNNNYTEGNLLKTYYTFEYNHVPVASIEAVATKENCLFSAMSIKVEKVPNDAYY